MGKNVLQFSEDGTEFHFIFANGSESLSYGSKEEGYKAIADLANSKKITVKEFREMRDQILSSEKLPWTEPSKRSFPGALGLLLALASIPFIEEISESFQTLGDDPVEIATFKLCGCGKIHGRIFLKNGGGSSLLESKQFAFFMLDSMKKANHVTDEEFEKVKLEIENSGMS